MKSERGVTLTSLVVYVIAMLITVTIITIITSYFYKNVEVQTESYNFLGEFTKLQSYFSEEANLETNKIVDISKNQNTASQVYIVFSSGNQYTFVKENKSIYINNVKIASHVQNCTFTEEIQNGKQVFVATIQIEDKTRVMKYALKNW
ncbi:MAG: hypothetical protein IKF38_00400 [Clostridia bacterium]|nr:hypothetical protein [Clostridia bacterium]